MPVRVKKHKVNMICSTIFFIFGVFMKHSFDIGSNIENISECQQKVPM